MPRLQKFSKKSFKALSSQNRTRDGVGSDEEDAPKRKGFQDEVDFHLGAMIQLTERKREGERETSKKVHININKNEGTYA